MAVIFMGIELRSLMRRRAVLSGASYFAVALTVITGVACSSASTGRETDVPGSASGGVTATRSDGVTPGGTAAMGGASGKASAGSGTLAAGLGAAAMSGTAASAGATGRAGASGATAMAGGAGAPASASSSGSSGAGTSGVGAVAGAAAQAAGSGGSGANCPLPTTFKWTSGAAIAQPQNGWVSLKDFTHVVYNNQHVVYMTTHDRSNWGAAMFKFDDWPNAGNATQTRLDFGVAPTLFYFTPKKVWVLAYQWGKSKFSYRTSSDPTDPNSWGPEQSLYNTALPSDGTGPIDQTVICDSSKCYLYYAGDNGHIYNSSMPIASFPGEFPAGQDSGIQGTSQNLFEAVQVYTIAGANKYLMIVEAQGSARYFRSWTASDLDGPWTLLADPFAAKRNVMFSGSTWTNDISHGDLIRTNPDETLTIDPCNLQMIFQGRDPSSAGDYGLLPYRPGLLTLAR